MSCGEQLGIGHVRADILNMHSIQCIFYLGMP